MNLNAWDWKRFMGEHLARVSDPFGIATPASYWRSQGVMVLIAEYQRARWRIAQMDLFGTVVT